MFLVETWRAKDSEPCLNIRIGAGIDDVFEVSNAILEEKGDELAEYCRSLPGLEDGASWQLLRHHTNSSGLGAKVLVGLGDHLKVWKMHPPQNMPMLWSANDTLQPMVLAGTVDRGTLDVVRAHKPSAGAFERNLVRCKKCQRPMGPWDSVMHDLVAAEPGGSECLPCAVGLGPGQAFKAKPPRVLTRR